MDIRFLIALSVISLIAGLSVAARIALSYYGMAWDYPSGLVWESILLVIAGLAVLLNLHRIEALQEKYRAKYKNR